VGRNLPTLNYGYVPYAPGQATKTKQSADAAKKSIDMMMRKENARLEIIIGGI